MLKLKRLLGLSGLTGLLAAAAFAVPAQANLKGECAVHGDAKTEDKFGLEGGVQLVGSEGKFTFESIEINCVGDTNKDGLPEPALGIIAEATGWYDNTVCGTGKAFGTVTDIEADNDKYELLENEKFAVQFVGTAGVFKWHDWDKPDANVPKAVDPDGDDSKQENEKDYTPAGDIHLGPPAQKPPVIPPPAGSCTKAFSATGTVLVDFKQQG